jgi:hypothetical protein
MGALLPVRVDLTQGEIVIGGLKSMQDVTVLLRVLSGLTFAEPALQVLSSDGEEKNPSPQFTVEVLEDPAQIMPAFPLTDQDVALDLPTPVMEEATEEEETFTPRKKAKDVPPPPTLPVTAPVVAPQLALPTPGRAAAPSPVVAPPAPPIAAPVAPPTVTSNTITVNGVVIPTACMEKTANLKSVVLSLLQFGYTKEEVPEKLEILKPAIKCVSIASDMSTRVARILKEAAI